MAACPARSTRQAERLRWILHTFSRRNFPSSVGPTTRFSPSRQMPLPRAEEQDRIHQETRRKLHPPRSTCTNSSVQGGECPWPLTWDQLIGMQSCWGQEFPTVGAKATITPNSIRYPSDRGHSVPTALPHCIVSAGETAVHASSVWMRWYPDCSPHTEGQLPSHAVACS